MCGRPYVATKQPGLVLALLLFPAHFAIIIPVMKTTRYFEEQVLRKRPYIQREWCERIMAKPLRRESQPDGRIRYWGIVPELGG